MTFSRTTHELSADARRTFLKPLLRSSALWAVLCAGHATAQSGSTTPRESATPDASSTDAPSISKGAPDGSASGEPEEASTEQPSTEEAPDKTAATPAAACFPACRSGYFCHLGQCISQCNPPCNSDQHCVSGECYLAVAPDSREPTVRSTAHAADTAAPLGLSDSASHAMGSVGITFRLGLAGQGKQHLEIDGASAVLRRRLGLMASLGINLLDGRGFGIDLNLTVRRYADSDLGYDYAYGTLTFEPTFGGRFQLAPSLYMFVGLGPRLGVDWLRRSQEKGFVSGARAPLQVTYYLTPSLALSGEVGVGAEFVLWSYDAVDEYDDDSSGTSAGPIYDLSLG